MIIKSKIILYNFLSKILIPIFRCLVRKKPQCVARTPTQNSTKNIVKSHKNPIFFSIRIFSNYNNKMKFFKSFISYKLPKTRFFTPKKIFKNKKTISDTLLNFLDEVLFKFLEKQRVLRFFQFTFFST